MPDSDEEETGETVSGGRENGEAEDRKGETVDASEPSDAGTDGETEAVSDRTPDEASAVTPEVEMPDVDEPPEETTSEFAADIETPEKEWDRNLDRLEEVDRAELEGERLLPIRREFVEDMLLELGEIAKSRGFHSLHEEVHEDRIPALREGQMSVVVLGEFNHGKSTVVNALLGEEILPVGITPTTAVITHLVYNDKPTVTVEPTGGGDSYEIAYNEMADLITEEDEAGFGEEPEYVEIGYPNDLLEESLVLVDTPGVNDISRQKVEITYGYVPRADVILYVLDATQILKKSEITFISERLLEANRDRIIFVLGKVDALSDEEAAEVEEYARERLEELIGPVDLYAFSGRDALEAQQAGDEPSEDFQTFRDELVEFLREEKAEIIIDSALGGGLRVASMLEQNLAIERQAYRLEKEELEERMERVRGKLEDSRELIADNLDLIDERIGGIAATAKHNLHVFRDEFLESLPRQIEAAEARDVQLYLSAWIQDQFKEWLEEEGAEIAESLEVLAEEVIEVTNESIQETVETFREEFGLAEQLDLDVDTVAYDMSVFALGGVGLSVLFLANTLVGGLLTAATPVLALFFKGKVDEKIKERAREEGERAINEATDAVEEELMRVIYEYGERLEEFVETAGDRLYRQVQEALAQVRKEVENPEQALKEVADRLERARRVGRLLKSSREKLRDKAES
ncbi:MAG: dynamin family protein [Bradymonadaceae bacterium]